MVGARIIDSFVKGTKGWMRVSQSAEKKGICELVILGF